MSQTPNAHRSRFSVFSMIAVLGACGASAMFAMAERPAPAGETGQPSVSLGSAVTPGGNVFTDPADLAQRANMTLGLRDGKVIDIDVDRTPGVPLNVPVLIDGQAFTLALMPHSVRSPLYRVQAQIADGSYIDVPPSPDRNLRGTLVEVPGSQVAGGILEDGLHIMIRMPNGERRWIQPLDGHVDGANPAQHILYRDEDVISSGGTCGTDDRLLAQDAPLGDIVPNAGGAGGTDGTTIYCAELGIDADFEYYTDYGSSVTNVENRINLVINTMNNQYINQVDIQHAITTIIVRTAEPDPYSSTDAGTLLNEFRNHWLASQGGVPRDVAQLFTGKALAGSTIGIAFTIGGICTTSAYCLVESDCCGGLACATDLSAHEFGHLWGGFHCSSACSSTMNPSITCVNTFTGSSPDSVAAIVAHRNSRTCLGSCEDATLPFFDDFPSTTFDSSKWASITGATISTVALAEPSAPNSIRLRGTHQARTARIDASNLGSMQLQYHYEQTGGQSAPGAGEDLVVEFYNDIGVWTETSRQLGSGPNQTTFVQETDVFPASAFHSEFRLRFRNLSTTSTADDWFVDNVSITGIAVPSNNVCANAPLKGAGSHAFTTIASSTDGPNEPASCNFGGYTHIENDVWFKVLAQCTGTMAISLCGASYNAKMAIYPTCPSGSGQALYCNDDSCGTSPQVSFPVTSNTLYWVRIGGFNGTTGSGTMVVTCTPGSSPCPADLSGDDTVGTPDLLALLNVWGACPGCPADLTGDNTVGTPDLLALINEWGPCPP